jgi:uncharacterized ferredoxin-like protein
MARIHVSEWPPYSPSDQAKKDNVLIAAKLMVNAALTAPCTGGVNGFEAELAYGKDELELIAREMERLAHKEVPERLKKPFLYEAVMVRESDVIVFLGDIRAHSSPMDVGCGLCGGEPNCSFVYDRVKHLNGNIDTTDRRRTTAIKGPLCMVRAHDLGYAVGSALWTASTLFVDSKPCYSVGLAGRNLNFCMNSEVVVGILLGVMSKNPYVDTPTDYHLTHMANQVDGVRRSNIIIRQIANHPYLRMDPSKKKGSAKNKKED